MKTETELKETWCPYADSRNRWGANPKLEALPFPAETSCLGFACSQCVDGGAVAVRHETGATTAEETDAMKPEGEGWRRSGYDWYRETGERHAYCGRNTGEALRHELSGMAEHIIHSIKNMN